MITIKTEINAKDVNGEARGLVCAYDGDRLIHPDTINLMSDASCRRFANAVAEKSGAEDTEKAAAIVSARLNERLEELLKQRKEIDDAETVAAPPAKKKVPGKLDAEGWPIGPNIVRYNEPLRIAEHFIEAHYKRHDDLTIRRYRKEWWNFLRSAYKKLPDETLCAKISRHVDGIWIPEVEAGAPTGKITKLVSRSSLVREVEQAVIACDTLVDGEMPQWVGAGDHPLPENIVTFPNGLLDVNRYRGGDLDLIPPTPRWFNTVVCPYDFKPDAKCPKWLALLHDYFDSDTESIALLQEWFGYQLVADNQYEKMMMLVGRPRSGKGTTIAMLTAMLGSDQVASTSFAKIASRFGLHPLLGKHSAIMPDAHIARTTDDTAALEVLKAITGSDPQGVDRKGVDELELVKLPVRFTIAVNELPELPDTAGALKSRTLLLYYTKTYAGREDTTLKRSVAQEAPGVALWALEGLCRLREEGKFTIPAKSKAITDEFERTVSPVKSFVCDCCELSDDLVNVWISKSELYAAWGAWCKERGDEPGNKARFGLMLFGACPKVEAGRRGPAGQQFYVYQGVRLCS